MIKLGRFEIHRIEESVLFEPVSLFHDWREEAVDPIRSWFQPDYYDADNEGFASSIHSWLVRTADTTILIDTCSGNGKERPASPRFDHLNTAYLDRLAEKGVTPGDVDYVLLTHLHVDHVGWNTRLVDGEWQPTFPNATYVMTRTERDWRDPERGAKGKPPGAIQPFLDSVQPVLDVDRAMLVNGDETDFLGNIDFTPTPGHAPGQMAVRLHDDGKEALFIADVMHQPIQVYNPDWSSKYCEDKETAVLTRKKILDLAAETGALILPAHFGGTHCGYVRRSGTGYSYVPLEEKP